MEFAPKNKANCTPAKIYNTPKVAAIFRNNFMAKLYH